MPYSALIGRVFCPGRNRIIPMKKIMPWIDLLTEVESTNFPARRDRIASLMTQAAQPSMNAAHYLAEAYVEGCKLEDDAKVHWSILEIEQAQRRTACLAQY